MPTINVLPFKVQPKPAMNALVNLVSPVFIVVATILLSAKKILLFYPRLIPVRKADGLFGPYSGIVFQLIRTGIQHREKRSGKGIADDFLFNTY
jgi:hypothetical protein